MHRLDVEFKINPKAQSHVFVTVLSYLFRLGLHILHVVELLQVVQRELQGEQVLEAVR